MIYDINKKRETEILKGVKKENSLVNNKK